MSSIAEENFDFVSKLNRLRLDGVGCDVIIQVGQRSFFAHRIVLIARMKYFQSLLTFDMLDRQQFIVPVDPEIVKPEIFEHILDYVYVFKVDFTPDNFEPICKAADYFCFDELLKKAKAFMKNNFKEEAVEPLMSLVTGKGSRELEEECEKLLITNPSSEIARKLLLPTLSFESLKVLISKLGTLFKREDAFNYCMEWIQHDPEARKDRMTELFETIELEHLSRSFLRNVAITNELVLADHSSLQLVALAVSDNKRPEKLFVLGGRDKSVLSSVSHYNTKTNKWKASTAMKKGLGYFGVAVNEQKIYVCGGFDGTFNSNEAKVFDTASKEWKELRSMNHPRGSPAAAMVNNHVYVAGGKDGNNRLLASFERYSIAAGRWQMLAPMNYERWGLELVELGGYLYAIGGWRDGAHVDIVEQYDRAKNQWKVVAAMNNPMAWFGSTVLNGKIYVASRKAFEVYDPVEDRWDELPQPTERGMGRQLAALNGRIYSIGGSYGTTEEYKGSKFVEYFDVEKQEWIQAGDMDVARCYHRVAVVKNC